MHTSTVTLDQWGQIELDLRRAEDAAFPYIPPPGTAEFAAFAEMKRQRARRRKAMGLSRAQAHFYVSRARRMRAAA